MYTYIYIYIYTHMMLTEGETVLSASIIPLERTRSLSERFAVFRPLSEMTLRGARIAWVRQAYILLVGSIPWPADSRSAAASSADVVVVLLSADAPSCGYTQPRVMTLRGGGGYC